MCARAASAAKGDLWPCLYCGAIVRVTGTDGSDALPTVERRVSADVMARVRERILGGGRDEAVALCEREGGVSREVALASVDDLVKSVSARAIASQNLNAVGCLFAVAALALVAGGIALVASDLPFGWVGWILAPFGLLNLVVLSRGIATSARFLSAPRATAEVRHVAHVGTQPFHGGVEVYSLAVDVTPERGPTFHGRLVIPVRAKNAARIAVGLRVPVRYRTEDPTWLRYDAAADPNRS